MHILDISLIIAYIVGLMAIGLWLKHKKKLDASYTVMARKLSLPAFIMTLVTTWYGAILGIGEFIFGFGIVGWVTNGLFWYGIYFFFAYALSKKIHESQFLTIADHLEAKIGKKTARIGAFFTYIMTTPAPYIFSLGLLVHTLFGWPLWIAIVVGCIVNAAYIWSGGFQAVVKTDMVQFVCMYIGFILLLVFSVATFGGVEFLQNNLPVTHFSWKGTLPVSTIVVWGFLALWTLVDPNFYQRCYAAKDAKTARNGVLWAILCWFLFDMLTLFTALYARAAFPDSNPLFSYLTLAQGILPVGILGIFCIALFSIIMSTIDSFLFSSSVLLEHHVFRPFTKNMSVTRLTQLGIVVTLAVSLLFIYIFQSVIGIIYAIGTIGVSSLLFPVLLCLFSKKKWSDTHICWSMIAASLVATPWLLYGWMHQEYGWPVYLWGIEPMYVGLFVSACFLGVAKMIQFKKSA